MRSIIIVVALLGMVGCSKPVKSSKVIVYYPDGRTVKKVDLKDIQE